MKSIICILLLFCSIAMFFPADSYANVALPIFIIAGLLYFTIGVVFVVIVEALAYSKELQTKFFVSVLVSFLANLVSSLPVFIGSFVSGVSIFEILNTIISKAVGSGIHAFADMAAYYVFGVVAYFLSVFIEYRFLKFFLTKRAIIISHEKIYKACTLANKVSYFFYFVLPFFFWFYSFFSGKSYEKIVWG